MSDRYKFDGLDAVIDTENDDAIEYDGLDKRAGDLVAHILNDNKRLYLSLDSLRVELKEQALTIERLTAPTSKQVDTLLRIMHTTAAIISERGCGAHPQIAPPSVNG